MLKEVHLTIAEEHMKIAQEYHEKMNNDSSKREAFRVVSGQNYFYALINFIESKLAVSDVHSHDHDSRLKNMVMRYQSFSPDLIKGYEEVSNIRGKVTYRAKNGKDYKKIRDITLLASKESGE